jgi:hypothetical protein
MKGLAMSQSIQRLVTGWMTKQSEFDFRQGQEFSIHHVIQEGSGTYRVAYKMAIKGSFSED